MGGAPVDTLSPRDNAVQNSGSLACEADAGACTSPDAGRVACIPTGPRDCTSDADNDCDGQPDNTLDDVCGCVSGTSEPCDEHPGLDGQGQCRAGLRTCVLDELTLTTAWGECEGAVGPGDADSCEPGDDTDCDGTPNEGCSCVDGQTQPCGSNTNTGPCQIGTSTCVDGRFGECIGAVAPANGDSCSSPNDDSNCNGIPFDGCSCVNGETQSCGMTDTGVCQLGTRTCVNGAFGQCVGQVNPRSRDCRSQQDNDCDGRPDNTIDTVCQCIPGQGNGPCSGDPNNSRCNDQGRCAPCQSNADCSVVSGGRNLCQGGCCVSPPQLPGPGAPCGAGGVCAANLQCAPNGICCQSACDGVCETCEVGSGVCRELETSPRCPALNCTGVPPRCSSFPPNVGTGQCAGRDACLSAQEYCQPRPLPIGSACLSPGGNPGKCQGVNDCDELEIQCSAGATPVVECDIEQTCCFGLNGPLCNAGTSCPANPFGFTELRVLCDEPSDCGVNEVCCMDDVSEAIPGISCRLPAQCTSPRRRLCGSPVASIPCPPSEPRCLALASPAPNWSFCQL